MDGNGIRTALIATSDKLRRDPAKARARGNPAIARLRDGLQCEVSGISDESLLTDMPPALGGSGASVNPGWLLRAAVASCQATVIALRAAETNIVLTVLEVEVGSESDLRGMLGIDEGIRAGLSTLTVRVRIGAEGADPDRLRELVAWGEKHAPVMDTLLHPASITSQVDIVSLASLRTKCRKSSRGRTECECGDHQPLDQRRQSCIERRYARHRRHVGPRFIYLRVQPLAEHGVRDADITATANTRSPCGRAKFENGRELSGILFAAGGTLALRPAVPATRPSLGRHPTDDRVLRRLGLPERASSVRSHAALRLFRRLTLPRREGLASRRLTVLALGSPVVGRYTYVLCVLFAIWWRFSCSRGCLFRRSRCRRSPCDASWSTAGLRTSTVGLSRTRNSIRTATDIHPISMRRLRMNSNSRLTTEAVMAVRPAAISAAITSPRSP